MRKKKKKFIFFGEVTKKDFVSIAKILCENGADTKLTGSLASYFKSQNPRFDTDRFIEATGKCRR